METAESNFLHKDLTARIIAAAIEVHKRLGPGFTEDVYEEAFAYELQLMGINFSRQAEFRIHYRDIIVHTYRADFLIENKVIVELKAVSKLADIHKTQVLSYLKACKLEVGLLLNFNVTMMKDGIERVIMSNCQSQPHRL
ncbi:GxxExxY protein, partial [candidate division WOR-3 bacterium]|nr:GxxExxY protein [candidate division WOR-3 bacterium]